MLSRIFLLASLADSAGFAQSNFGRIDGTVSDTSGAPMPGVTVTATNPQTGAANTATTNDSGGFVLLQLPAGSFDLTAEKQGS